MALENGWAEALINWYDAVRRDLPWRRTSDPYLIWISEIMLQQTRVEAVIAYYHRFMAAFPTVQALANAPLEAVLKAWEGLGYYSRARNLHKAAQIVSNSFDGVFPDSYDGLRKLPGIGEYTAGAIASIAFGKSVPAIDGNVKRVTARLIGIRENINQPSILRDIRHILTNAIPKGRASQFNQALMELGAMVCIPGAPRCEQCPLNGYCDAFAAGDADSLPVIDRKKPPKSVSVAVCLLTYGKSLLVFKRKERLLKGLYVFGLTEDITNTEDVQQYWAERGLTICFVQDMGSARHIFTHRVWEMNILHFELTKEPNTAFLREYDARLADVHLLQALPFPTAMKTAKQAAIQVFKQQG